MKLTINLILVFGLTACSGLFTSQDHPDVIRIPAKINSVQKEIDDIRDRTYDNTKYGRSETRPWNDRYLGNNPNYPYQGPTLGHMSGK